MRKITIVLSILVLAAMLLTACGGGEEKNEGNKQIPTSIPPTLPSSTPASTETVTAGNTTTTPGIPVTGGEDNPARLSKELGFKVWDKDGNEIGTVNDMVLDFDNAKATYVVVGSGGFLGIGEKKILVPWNSLKLQANPNGGQDNGFVLQTDVNAIKNAPDFDLNNLPPLGQPAGTWDAQIRDFWQNPGAAAKATNTPAANATTAPTMTATANPNNGNGTGANVVALKGVALASKLLGSTVMLANQTGASNNAGKGANAATATPAANTGGAQATATVGSAVATVTAVAGPSGNNVSATVKDMIMDMKAGKVQFVVVDAKFDDGEHWIPIPLKLFQWDSNAQAFVLKADAAMLQKAPSFQEDQFPNTATSGWDTAFNKFWQK